MAPTSARSPRSANHPKEITGSYSAAAASPDGKYVVLDYADTLLRLPSGAENADLGETTVLRGFPAEYPAISPDSNHVLFSVHGALWQTGIDGKGAEQIHDFGGDNSGQWPRFLSYSPSGSELSFQQEGRIYKMSTGGGKATLVAPIEDTLTLAQAVAGTNPEMVAELEAAEDAVTPYLLGSSSEGFLDVNEGERTFCEANFEQANECRLFYGDRQRALDMRGRLFTNRNAVDRSTRGNAFQHGFWTALMSKDSTRYHEVAGVLLRDGLVFALLHEGPPPFSWDSQMDIINDWTGDKFWRDEGAPSVHQEDVCEALRIKGGNAIFLGGGESPYKWMRSRAFYFKRLVFRKLRSALGAGAVVRPNGRTCAETW
jgi:hypothetical protein